MKDADLEALFRSHNGTSIVAALRLIYNAGYCDGASITPDSNFVDRSVVAVKPTEAVVIAIKSKTSSR